MTLSFSFCLALLHTISALELVESSLTNETKQSVSTITAQFKSTSSYFYSVSSTVTGASHSSSPSGQSSSSTQELASLNRNSTFSYHNDVTSTTFATSIEPQQMMLTVWCERLNETAANCRWKPNTKTSYTRTLIAFSSVDVVNDSVVTNSSELSLSNLKNCTSYWFSVTGGQESVRCWIPPINLNQTLQPNPLYPTELNNALELEKKCGTDGNVSYSLSYHYQAVNSSGNYDLTINKTTQEFMLHTCVLYAVTVLFWQSTINNYNDSDSSNSYHDKDKDKQLVNQTYSPIDLEQELQVQFNYTNSTVNTIYASWSPIDSQCNITHELTISSATGTKTKYSREGNARDFLFPELQPYTNYSIYLKRCVDLVNGRYCGKESVTHVTTNESVPDAPEVSVVLDVSWVNITWTAPPNPKGFIDKYRVSWTVVKSHSDDSAINQTIQDTVTGTETHFYKNFTFGGCTTYNFSVTGETKAGSGIAGSAQNTTPAYAAPPYWQVEKIPASGSLNVTVIGDRKEGCYNLTRYRVIAKNQKDDNHSIDEELEDCQSKELSTLPYSNYTVYVEQRIEFENSSYTQTSNKTIETGQTSPANFTIIVDYGTKHMQYVVKWNRPNPMNGQLESYHLFYSCRKLEGQQEYNENFQTSEEQCTIELQAHSDCKVDVVASTGGGKTSSSYSFRTQVSYPPPISTDKVQREIQAASNNGEKPTTQISVSFASNPFNESNGRLKHIQVLYGAADVVEKYKKFSCEGNWQTQSDLKDVCSHEMGTNTFPLLCIIENLEASTNYTIVLLGKTSDECYRSIAFLVATSESKVAIIVVTTLVIVLLVLSILIAVHFHNKIKPKSRTSNSSDEKYNQNELDFFGPIHSVAVKPGVALSEFPHYVDTMHRDANLLFQNEYVKLCTEAPRYACTAANIEVNKIKNRYKDVLPFDLSRVKLLGGESEDFINANYMPGFHSRREYIATQGPLIATICDFWRMVWEQNIRVIVMLTLTVENGKLKCEKYWPNHAETLVISNGAIFHATITCKSEMVTTDYTIRIFTFTCGSTVRNVVHCHFTTWPDRACPSSRTVMIGFVREVRKYQPKENFSPICVHCSAGVGRTGTFITIDRIMQEITNGRKEIRVFEAVMDLRYNRCTMVQNEEQYVFIHDCLVEFLHERQHLNQSFDNETDKKNGTVTSKL